MLRKGISLLLGLACLLCAAESAAVWLDVPFVKQEKGGCGAASISMVMQYWGREDAAAGGIQKALYNRRAGGILASDMQRYLDGHGFRTFTFEGGWQDLETHLSKGRPLIVCLKEGIARHYVVVAGLNPRENVVRLNDPAQRKLTKLDRGEFEKAWTAGGNWTLLALPE